MVKMVVIADHVRTYTLFFFFIRGLNASRPNQCRQQYVRARLAINE